MSEAVERLRALVVEKALHGPGKASGDARRAAFDNADSAPARALVAKVTANAWKVTDEDVAAAKRAGLSDDEIFELVVCAALGQSTRQLDAALAALDEA
jgi:alkylhydroperoxidase family enzyme